MLTSNKVIRVKMNQDNPVKVKKKFDIPFPELLDPDLLILKSEHAVKAEFSLEGKKLVAEFEFPVTVMKSKFVGNLEIVGKDIPLTKLVFIIQ